MDLPRLITIQSKLNSRNLCYVKGGGGGGDLHGFVRCSSPEMLSPYTQFEVELARGGARSRKDGGLIHIKSCYNNKYLVPNYKYYTTMVHIVAGSDEPEEDQNKSSCTLFQASYFENFKAYRIRHVYSGLYLSVCDNSHGYGDCLAPVFEDRPHGLAIYFTIVDWESLCILPRYVAFKQVGSFLKCYDYENQYYLQFGASDVQDKLAGHEVFPLNDGRIRIKSNAFGYFWRLATNNWIYADRKHDYAFRDELDIVFWPVKVAGFENVFAFRNCGNDLYCERLTQDDKENCLNAGVGAITDEAKIEVYECVISREINYVQFQTKDARFFGIKPQTMATYNPSNHTNESDTHVVRLGYMKSKSSTWQTTMGMNLGVTTTMSTGVPLIIAEAEIEISTQLYTEYSMGETYVKREDVTTEIEVTVPPNSERKVSVVAIQGQCDIPFSYTQKDYLADGRVVYTQKYDGIYSGLNYYKFEEVVDDPRPINP